MNALANDEVGKYLNEYFVSSFQKVATFRIVGNQKQGGNVASYFCAPDGRVLHAIAGPVDAATMLREAKWVVETTKKAIAEFLGTFWLVFGGCGSAVLAAAFPGLGIAFVGVALAFGLTVRLFDALTGLLQPVFTV